MTNDAMIESFDPVKNLRGWIDPTPDGHSGDVTVELNIPMPSPDAPRLVGIAARGDSPTLADGSASFYAAWMEPATGRVGILLQRGRKPQALASLTPAEVATGPRKLSFVLSGETLSLTVQDPERLRWLGPDGTWGPVPVAALVATDATLAGSGYAGYLAIQPAR